MSPFTNPTFEITTPLFFEEKYYVITISSQTESSEAAWTRHLGAEIIQLTGFF
jgi:hypothetical protein